MIRVEVRGLQQTLSRIAGMGKQVRYATAVALTRTAYAVKNAMPAEMERDIDRPTPFTKRGLFVKAARKDDLTAVVGFMDRQASYMKYLISGGTRTPTARGIKLPGNIELNSFGNIPKGMIAKLKSAVLSGKVSAGVGQQIGVFGDRRKKAAPVQLFYGKPVGRGWERSPMGIWRRIPPSSAGGKGKLIPIIVFEDTPARYRPRFDFHRKARQIVAREWDKQFARAFDEAMRSAR